MRTTSRLLPAGVPRSLLRLREAIAAWLSSAPLLFVGVVVVIAVGFKLLVGVLAPPAVADRDPDPTEARPHEAPASSPGSAEPRTAGAVAAPAASMTPEPHLHASAAPPAPPRRKPRTHGRR